MCYSQRNTPNFQVKKLYVAIFKYVSNLAVLLQKPGNCCIEWQHCFMGKAVNGSKITKLGLNRQLK